ncbi:hypothetical protein D3C80_1550730 [compost metagenome]
MRHKNGLVVSALWRAHAYKHARQQDAVGIGELAAQRHLPRATIHRDVGKHQRALALVCGAVDANRQRLVVGSGEFPVLERLAQAQRISGRLSEIDIDRIKLLNSRHQRRVALANQGTFGHQRAADATRNRCGHRSITEVQAGALQVGLGRTGGRLSAA